MRFPSKGPQKVIVVLTDYLKVSGFDGGHITFSQLDHILTCAVPGVQIVLKRDITGPSTGETPCL